MADPKTFTLIGEFKDGITPELASINRQLTSLQKSFQNFGGKGARNASRDAGRFSVAVSSLNENLKAQNQSLRAAVAPMREYRREVGKTIGALTRLNLAASGTDGIYATNRALREQIFLQRQLRSINTRRSVNAGPGGPVGGNRRSSGGAGGRGFSMADFGFSFTLGNTIAQLVQSGVTAGFRTGVDLMMKPFQYFAGAFGERVQDELSDLKAAGGLFSISKRSKNPFLRDIDEAIQFQQDTNQAFAKMAADLPGVTNDYVQVGKRLSDTIARITNQDFAAAKARADQIRSTEEGKRYYGGAIKGDMATQQQEVIKTLLGNLTQKATIAGLGGTRTAGGISGAYGLPGIIERMMSEEQVSVAKFQRYASVFADPTIADALRRNVDRINKSGMNTTQRYDALVQLLDEVVTPELIEKLRTSVDGIYQGYKAAFFDPDTGLFGLGRQFKGIGKKLNKYGQYVNKAGQVVSDMADAAPADLSIFEIVRDIFANFGQALMPIVDILPQIFDPLKNVADALMKVRHYAAEFNRTFNIYRQGFLDLAKIPGNEFIKGTADVRASLLAITNFLRDFGVIGMQDFVDIRDLLKTKDANFGEIFTSLVDKLLNSDMALSIGETIGEVIGIVLVDVSKATGFLSGRLKGSSKLFEGLSSGFEKSGGFDAVKKILDDVFKIMWRVLKFIWDHTPFEAKLLGAFLLIGPAVIQGLAMKISTALNNGINNLGNRAKAEIGKAFKNVRNPPPPPNIGPPPVTPGSVASTNVRTPGKVIATPNATFRPVGPQPPKGFERIALPGQAPTVVSGVRAPGTAPSIPKAIPKLTRPSFGPLANLRGKGVGIIAPALIALSTHAPQLAKAGNAIKNMAKGAPGVGAAVTAVDFGLRKVGGQDTKTAAGGAIGSGIGGALGFALGSFIPVPGAGIAGGFLGSWLGGWIGEQLGPALTDLPSKLSGMWEGIKTWFYNLPVTIGYAIGQLGANFQKFGAWWQSLGPKFDKWLNNFIEGAKNFMKKAGDWAKKPSNWKALIQGIIKGIQNAISGALGGLGNAWNWLTGGFAKGLNAGYQETLADYKSTETKNRQQGGASGFFANIDWKTPVDNASKKPPGSRYMGGLSDAISSEMKNKPAGSSLVVANSSETVIPAAGGYGMKNFLSQVTMAVSSANRSSLGRGPVTINAPITIYQSEGQDSEQLAAAVIGRLREAVNNAQGTTFG